MSAKSMWGNLDELQKIKTPGGILQEQAQLLTEATSGVLEGLVNVHSTKGEILVTLVIIVHALNQYAYEVLEVRHGVMIYPARVFDATDRKDWVQCQTEEEFVTEVEHILSSEKVRNVLESLISQSESLGGEK